MKLWNKGHELNETIDKFTVGNDHLLDDELVQFDCKASIAHAKMLNKTGVLTQEELNKTIKGLNEIIELHSKGKFEIKPEDEDCHTAIENYLTNKYGDVGKKIHTARSRNDQVLAALQLYEKSELSEIKKLLNYLKKKLVQFIDNNGKVQIPGYTHMQKAMPTTIKDWIGSYICAIDDDLIILESVIKIVDQSPSGSAAGYGVPVFKIDKEMTAKLMGFSKVMDSPVYAQTSRGKFTAEILNFLSQIMFDLNKLATDLILFNMKEFGFVDLPVEFCTGSSIMPQKKNPDVLELIKAKYHVILGEEFKVKSMISNLTSGYNRDLQLTKEPFFNAIKTTKECIHIMSLILPKIKINKEKCEKAMTPEIFATEEAYKLVKEGKPFRDAYKEVGKKFKGK